MIPILKLNGSMNWIEKFNFMHANATLINGGFGELVNQVCKTAAVANGHDCFSFDNMQFPPSEFKELISIIRNSFPIF